MNFNAESETNKIINFIRKYYKDNNLGGVVIGISGGKDSAVVAGLFVEALGKENVIGVTIPCYSKEQDMLDANQLSQYYGFKLINFDITNIFENFKQELKNLGNFNLEQTNNSDINLKPRLRISTLYYLATLFSTIEKRKYLVAGTINKSEMFVGYFTKGADSVHDISVLSDFTVEEVIAIGEYIKVPKNILYKQPNDGLSNKTDEEKLGVLYKEIAEFMEDPNKLNRDVADKIQELHEKNLHKFNIPTYRKEN